MGTDVVGTGLPWVEAIAESFEPLDFVTFHHCELPALSARHGHLVVGDLRGVAPLAFCSDEGVAFTWVASEDGVRVMEGDAEATTVVELSERTFSEFVGELLTASGAVRTGRARVTRGALGGWQRWEPAIQSLCSGREIYSAAARETLVDRAGAPLDMRQAFAADDDVDEMRHFLDRTGYLHIKAVFTTEEVERYSSEVENAGANTVAGDPFSWWSVNAHGDEVVTRINYLGRHSRVLQELSHDTEPGDLTVHYGDTMHTTPPPTADGAGRRALDYKFAEAKTFEWIPAGCHYNDALFRSDPDGRVANRVTTWQINEY